MYRDYSDGIQLILKSRIEERGNKYNKNINYISNIEAGGFDWSESREGGLFWTRVLEDQNYEVFYEMYPDLRYYTNNKAKFIESKDKKTVYEAFCNNQRYKITIEKI